MRISSSFELEVMRRVKHPPRKTGNSLLEQIGKKRDGLLILISCIYILGYIVWSLHAMVNHFGLLPAIDAQYFLAGMIPGIIAYLAYLFLAHSRSVSAALLKLLRPRRSGVRQYTVLFIGVLLITWIIIIFLTWDWSRPFWSFQPIWKQKRITIILSWMLIPVLYLFFHSSERVAGRKFIHKMSAWYFSIIVSLYLTAMYIFWIYPILPQELGGVKPRCAFIDEEATKVSEQTLRAIFDLTNKPTGVLRSVKLRVLYTGGEYLLVKPDGNQETTTYELKRGELTAITWCD